MVRESDSEREQRRVRGRPFQKGNFYGKPKNVILDSTGHQSSTKRGDVAPTLKKHEETKPKEEIPEMKQSPNKIETITTLPEPIISEFAQTSSAIDSMEFKNGENTLTIKLIKKDNRAFRIQVFLNDTTEIRPVTYAGLSTALTVWNLLKGSLIK